MNLLLLCVSRLGALLSLALSRGGCSCAGGNSFEGPEGSEAKLLASCQGVGQARSHRTHLL